MGGKWAESGGSSCGYSSYEPAVVVLPNQSVESGLISLRLHVSLPPSPSYENFVELEDSPPAAHPVFVRHAGFFRGLWVRP